MSSYVRSRILTVYNSQIIARSQIIENLLLIWH